MPERRPPSERVVNYVGTAFATIAAVVMTVLFLAVSFAVLVSAWWLVRWVVDR